MAPAPEGRTAAGSSPVSRSSPSPLVADPVVLACTAIIYPKRKGRLVAALQGHEPARLTAAGGRPAVAAGVAGACAHHPAAAAGALDRVLVRVEQRRLARGGNGGVELLHLGRAG